MYVCRPLSATIHHGGVMLKIPYGLDSILNGLGLFKTLFLIARFILEKKNTPKIQKKTTFITLNLKAVKIEYKGKYLLFETVFWWTYAEYMKYEKLSLY